MVIANCELAGHSKCRLNAVLAGEQISTCFVNFVQYCKRCAWTVFLPPRLGMEVGMNWSCRGKWEWELSLFMGMGWDGNGKDVIGVGGNWDEIIIEAHV